MAGAGFPKTPVGALNASQSHAGRISLSPPWNGNKWPPTWVTAVQAELLHALGVRIGVIFALRWEQVDFQTRTLQYRSKGKDITRVLGKRAMAILQSLEPKASGLVFPTGQLSAFRSAWVKAAKAIGRPGARPHDLRITFAREMADEGVDTGTIRDMLGHSSSRMTERYIGSSRSAQIRATELHDIRAGFV